MDDIYNTTIRYFIFNIYKHTQNMTLYVNDTFETFASNNTAITGNVVFILTGQFSKTDTVLPSTVVLENARYTELQLEFPVNFKNEHMNGIYYYTIQNDTDVFEKGLVKLITEPGGDNGAIEYTSTPETENRESVVYYRPEY